MVSASAFAIGRMFERLNEIEEVLGHGDFVAVIFLAREAGGAAGMDGTDSHQNFINDLDWRAWERLPASLNVPRRDTLVFQCEPAAELNADDADDTQINADQTESDLRESLFLPHLRGYFMGF